MKTLKILPSSKEAQEMNDAQWLWCYANIVKDEEEQEELWKERIKFNGLFINPDAVAEINKIEKNKSSFNPFSSSEGMYNNDSFESELLNAMNGSTNGSGFVELPQEDDTRGDANISSDEFLKQVQNNIDLFTDVQKQIDNEIFAKKNGISDDLDMIEVDDD